MDDLKLVVMILAIVAMVTNLSLAVIFGGWLRVVCILAAVSGFVGFLLLFMGR